MTKVLLVSTYDLGRRPSELAWASGALEHAGHEVRCLDVDVEGWNEARLEWPDVVAFYVPMHTATSLALELADAVKSAGSAKPAAAFGLYADAATRDGRVDAGFAGEYLESLVAWVGHPTRRDAAEVSLRSPALAVPDHSHLPALTEYGRLRVGGEEKIVGSLSTTRGCPSRCLHCPVPVVYDGRVRPTSLEDVLAEADVLVSDGAQHLTFSDADFLGAPKHSLRCAEAIHARHPDVTFDVTVRVDRILRHADEWTRMARLGCLYVVSAFESTDGVVLDALDKGHTASDMHDAVVLLRGSGIEVRPTWLPFTPLTRREALVDILDFVEAHDLVENVDPVQYSVRLLVPPGSLVLSSPAFRPSIGEYDATSLSWTWKSPDPELDRLQAELAAIAEDALDRSVAHGETFEAVRNAVHASTRLARRRVEIVSAGPASRPRPSEAWFCCAEPTATQRTESGCAARDCPQASDQCAESP